MQGNKIQGDNQTRYGLIGCGMMEDHEAAPPITNAHGLSIEWIRIPPGQSLDAR